MNALVTQICAVQMPNATIHMEVIFATVTKVVNPCFEQVILNVCYNRSDTVNSKAIHRQGFISNQVEIRITM